MSPTMTIFGNSDLHPFINGLRSAFIDFVIENDVEELPDVVEMTENTPILLAEVLVRVMNIETIDAHKFVFPKMLKVLGQNLVNLCQTKYEFLYQPRSALFTFVFRLFKNIDLAWKCFTCENFVSLFMSLSLETDLTETIFFAVRDALTNFDSSYDANQLNPLIDWYYKTIQFCVNEAKSDVYLHYLQVVITTMADCFGEQPWLSISFRPILKLLLDILEVRPDRLILENTIKLLSAIERTVDKFYLNRSLFARLVKVIKLVDKEEPSTRIELLLMSLLSGYCAMTTLTRFYIKEPSVIPLIIAVFGQSSRFVDILKTFKQLCDYTAFNCRQFHDGDLDWILMTYISQKKDKATFKYRNVDISISLEHSDIEKYVLPLITSMAVSKSSTAISTIMANYISTDVDQHSFDFCNYLDILLGKCAITPTKTFSMNTSPDPQFSVQGIFGEDLNKGFTISLRLNIDATPMTASNASISLFTITDDDYNLLRCFLSAGHIFMKYEADCTRTSVILAKNVPSQQWTLYTIIVRMDGQMVKLSTFENNQSLNDSDLCEFTFNPTKLEFVVGGLNEPMENSQWDDIQMGEFGDLNLYTELLTQSDINVLYSQPWSFTKVPLFSTSSIPTPGLKSTFTTPRKRIAVNSSLFSNYIENLTINVSDCKTPSLHLLDNMVDGDYGNILAGFFRQEQFFNNEYPPLILGLIKSIFKRSLKSQIGFTSLLTMTTNLSQHPMILNSELYLALYHVFESIQYEALHFQWFTKLVFNFWLWVNCENYNDLFFILQHWHSILLPNLTDLVKQKSFFSVLLSQYKMILCFDKEDENIEKIEDINYEHSINIMKYFTKGYTVKNVLAIRDIFVKIMKRTAFINFTSSDFRNLFSLLATSKTRTTSLIMLDIIHNITKPILQTKMVSHKYNAILEEFVKSDNLEIVKSAIICLHSISYQNMIEYSQQISENI
ncbi:aggrephagy protein, partial [Trichomonas vaginalis G3]